LDAAHAPPRRRRVHAPDGTAAFLALRHEDRTVVAGFVESVRNLRGVEPDDIELYAAQERLKCYQVFEAVDLPPDGGAPVLAEHCLTVRPTWADQVRAERRTRERTAEAAEDRSKKFRDSWGEVQRWRREAGRKEEAERRFRVALPGSVVKVYFDSDEGDAVTFVIAERLVVPDAAIEAVSPSSPLGNALIGAQEGETRTYTGPHGDAFSVTLVSTRPYDGPVLIHCLETSTYEDLKTSCRRWHGDMTDIVDQQ
jgi:transcription elongation GreA/GreB family factor